jgi:hypothetical protein
MNRVFLLNIAFGILMSLSIGCSTIHYRNSNTIPVFVGPTPNHSIKKSRVGRTQFFLWGAVPRLHYVFVDQEIKDMGFVSGANVSIEEFQTWGDFALTLFSLGIVIPKSYRIEAYGEEGEY